MSPTLAAINAMDRAAFTAALGHLFEHSSWVAEETWDKRPFGSSEALHRALCATLASAPLSRKVALIRAHPDLAGRLAQMGQLTAASTAEQASAGLNSLPAQELAAFQQLNSAYKDKFGFPFVICARLNDKATILRALESRANNGADLERETALKEIEKIAWLRLGDLLRT